MTTHIISAPRALVGPNLDLLEHASVVVKGRIIEWVGPHEAMPQEFSSLPTRYFEDATILPGLIDSHVHLGGDGGSDPFGRMRRETDHEQVALMLKSARELLSVGVTSARNLGARNNLDIVVRDAIANGTARGPRILAAGEPLTPTGGHCWFMNGEVDGELEIRRLIRQHHKDGVDLIKIMSSGGFSTERSAPWNVQFSVEELTAAADEAHRAGLQISAHAHSSAAIRSALDAGVDFLEHCTFIDGAGLRVFDEELAGRIIEQGVVISPTVNWSYGQGREGSPEDWSHHQLARAGARFVASTDAGIEGVPHWAFPQAVEKLQVATGWDTPRTLRAATSDAASALGIERVTGALSPGLAADIIVVRGNPHEDLTSLQDLLHVEALGVEFIPDPHPPLPEKRDMTRFFATPTNH